MMLPHPQDFQPRRPAKIQPMDQDEGYALCIARLAGRGVAGAAVIGLLCVVLYGMLAL